MVRAVVIATLSLAFGCGSEPVTSPDECPAGTRVEDDGTCRGPSCGTGTKKVGDRCEPLCAAGSTLDEDGETCVATLVCGPGTHLDGSACVPDPDIACGPGTHLEENACVVNDGTFTCGDGTHGEGDACVPDPPAVITCGAGTHLVTELCELDDELGFSCGEGTVADGSACVSDAIQCGTDTVETNGECLPGYAEVTCGSDTDREGDACLPELACGPGTVADGTTCVVDTSSPLAGQYEVRIAQSVQAMPFPVQVFLLAKDPDGTDIDGLDVSLRLDRTSAGSIVSALALGPTGARTSFRPCSAATTGCLGPARVDMLVDGQVVASASFDLVTPTGVGDPGPCLVGGNVLYMNGAGDFVFPGEDSIVDGVFSTLPFFNGGRVSMTVNTRYPNEEGDFWNVELEPIEGEELLVGVYEGAERFASATAPSLDVSGDGRGCNQSFGTFEILELDADDTGVNRLTATWLQSCESEGEPPMAGCIHYEE